VLLPDSLLGFKIGDATLFFDSFGVGVGISVCGVWSGFCLGYFVACRYFGCREFVSGLFFARRALSSVSIV